MNDFPRGDGFVRVLGVLFYLTEAPATRAAIAQEFSVTRRTANRYMTYLRDAGVKLQRLSGNRWYVPTDWWDEFLGGAYDRCRRSSG